MDDFYTRVAAAIHQAAEAAILTRFRRLAAHEIVEKSPGEPVKQADHGAEAMLTPVLLSLLAGSRVVGEEATAANPALLDDLDHGHVWLVDPLDGTRNFASAAHLTLGTRLRLDPKPSV